MFSLAFNTTTIASRTGEEDYLALKYLLIDYSKEKGRKGLVLYFLPYEDIFLYTVLVQSWIVYIKKHSRQKVGQYDSLVTNWFREA